MNTSGPTPASSIRSPHAASRKPSSPGTGIQAAECYLECYLVSQIGRRVRDPQLADVRLLLEDHRRPVDVAPQVRAIVERELEDLKDVWRAVMDGKVPMY